eukprot:TRINITY_DN6488_c0_g1_i1.p1 TRINITY_DN6488_c0_g1~~TRINITY_DN6488_c0_g1_i1.p1  ORF type:complete len:549 (-),score=217.74 TRINITY_DN6488_c0_g1_i1:113-1759(-)
MDRQVLLADPSGLVGVDLYQAYKAVRSNQSPAGVIPRFKKKEDISSMAKSILKHKIQTLTGKSVKTIEDEMKYQPKDPNEPSMDIDTMRRLASSLVLLSNKELPNYAEPEVPEAAPPVKAGSKRSSSSQVEAEVSKPKAGRRSLAVAPFDSSITSTISSVSKTKSRRSIAVLPTPEKMDPPLRKGRKSLAVMGMSDSVAPSPVSRSNRRSLASVTPSRNGSAHTNGNTSSSSSVSLSVTNCLGPASTMGDNLALLEEEETEEVDSSMANPTPLMKEMMKKRKSLAPKPVKSPVKVKPPSPIRPPSPEPRADFIGSNDSRVYLMAGDPMDLKLTKLTSTLPLSAQFPGAHLTVVHTPAEWTPTEIFQVSKQIKLLNKEAGLPSFVVLVGTGLHNVHMNMEAIMRHTQHVQFVTFHREDANTTVESGKLRETTSFFLVAYFFPGCEKEGSKLPTKMVRDGYSTCFRTEGTAHLERSIIDCFSESGEWLLDLCCGARQLSLAAAEKGRSAIALHNDGAALEELGNYLRTLALRTDQTYRDKDGVVLNVVNQ